MAARVPCRRHRQRDEAWDRVVLPLVLAAALDLLLCEPPLPLHPTRGIGAMLDRLATVVPAAPRRAARARGALMWATGLTVTSVAGIAVDRSLGRLPRTTAGIGRGIALWPLVSLRMLVDEVAAVETALGEDIDAGRATVARLVSRDVGELDRTRVREAAISSLAENLVDAWVAPFAWFAVGGLPAAAAYRFINTADAMWGHRDARWRHAGTVAARADDLANLLPARLCGVTLALPHVPLRSLYREADRTPSPNGGWPMAAVALRLGIRLSKPSTYVLHAVGRRARAADTAAAIRLVTGRAIGLVTAIAALRVCGPAWRSRRCRR
ncbi:MAG: adenosylcobinamide-phosphate synthase CbiB [Nitriliruptoraceae bacterium]